MRNQPSANRPRQTGSPDRFSAYLKRRLDRHRMPVDDACWEAIEKELNRQSDSIPVRRRKLPLWTFAAAAAIALLLLLVFPFRPYRPDAERIAGLSPVETTPSPAAETADGLSSVPPASPVENAPRKADEGTTKNEPIVRKTQPSCATRTGENKRNAASPKGTDRQETATPQSQTGQPKTEPDKIDRTRTPPRPVQNLLADGEKPSGKKRPVTGPEPPASANRPARSGRSPLDGAEKTKDASPVDPAAPAIGETLYSSVYPKRPRHSWQIAAAVGTGNSVSFQGNTDVLDTGPSQNPSQDPEPGTPGITLPPLVDPEPSFRPEDFAGASYSLPLTFGITVRKELNRWLGVESGLVYTYLSTRYARSGTAGYEGRLTLHYLGIPLQAVIQIWQNRRWSAYFAAGGTIEKGLQAAYHVESFDTAGDTFTSYSERKNISGIQFSLNGAVGFAYRFHGGWSLYAEPRLSYYFDNDQPPSIRTDQPVMVGLGAGLRYAF